MKLKVQKTVDDTNDITFLSDAPKQEKFLKISIVKDLSNNIKLQKQAEAGFKFDHIFVISTATEDRVGDTIDQKGWFIDNYNTKSPEGEVCGPVQPFHKYDEYPIGKSYVWLEGDKLMAGIKYATDIEGYDGGKIAKQMVDKNYIKSASVGFRGLTGKSTKTGTHFTTMELLEWSLVPIPANSEARNTMKEEGINIVKALEIGLLKDANDGDDTTEDPEDGYDVDTMKQLIPMLSGLMRSCAQVLENVDNPSLRYMLADIIGSCAYKITSMMNLWDQLTGDTEDFWMCCGMKKYELEAFAKAYPVEDIAKVKEISEKRKEKNKTFVKYMKEMRSTFDLPTLDTVEKNMRQLSSIVNSLRNQETVKPSADQKGIVISDVDHSKKQLRFRFSKNSNS